MGIVNLPSMDDIQQQKEPKQQMEMLINTLGILMKELGEINGYLGGANIRANSITAVKLDVDKLSAITANIGEITAGIIRGIEIYGSYIATAEGTYPRAEMSNTNNLFGAYKDANNYIEMDADYVGSPIINVVEGGTQRGQIGSNSMNLMIAATTNLNLKSGAGDIHLDPGIGKVTRVDTFAEFYSTGEGKSLQTALNEKESAIFAFSNYASNMTFDNVSRNLKLFARDGTQLAIVNIPKT